MEKKITSNTFISDTLEKIGIKEKLNLEFSFNSLNDKYIDDLCKTMCKSDIEKEYEIFYTIESSGNNINRKCSKEEKKNRYSDIIPYEYNKVSTSNGYINASWINAPYNKAFIGTQGPLGHTEEDFWQMIVETDSTMIVMLCNVEENGRIKCNQYWPKDGQSSKKYSNMKITLLEEAASKSLPLLIHRTLKISDIKVKNCNKNEIIVNQLHFTGWPDHGVPDMKVAFHYYMKMFELVDNNNKEKGNTPTVVHCSAGIGRTGTFMSSFVLWTKLTQQYLHLKSVSANKELEKQKTKEDFKFSIFNTVVKVKDFRCYSVENPLQYEFIYSFILQLLQKFKHK